MQHQHPGSGDTTQTFGHRYLTKYGWHQNNPIGKNPKNPNAIIEPLFELKGLFDEHQVIYLKKILNKKDKRKFTLLNEIHELIYNDIETTTNTSQNQPRVEYFRLGSHQGPLLHDIGTQIYELHL